MFYRLIFILDQFASGNLSEDGLSLQLWRHAEEDAILYRILYVRS